MARTVEEQSDQVVMAVTACHYNNTETLFDNLFKQKQNLDINYLSGLDMSKTYIIIITDYM